ncbi:MAG: hypothetical protein ACTHMF_11345 [Leifsonia sp.]|uniref:hypothetical protein n=1 Tax=Leifsonia sp. TaxID=1870902 RepID=UPI003F7EAA42
MRAAAAAERVTVLPAPEGSLPRDRPGEHSVLVVGDELAEPAILRLRDEAAVGRPLAEECRAREEAASEYVPVALGPPRVRTLRGRPVSSVLLPQAQGGTLNTLLAARATFGAGEAATILLATARAIAHLHAFGWAGVAVSTETVAFRADGCPVLARMDTVRPWTAALADADRAAYRTFAAAVCGAVGGPAGRERQTLHAAVRDALVGGGWEEVIVAVLRAAAPTAVRLPRGVPDGVDSVSSVGAAASVPALPATAAGAPRASPASRRAGSVRAGAVRAGSVRAKSAQGRPTPARSVRVGPLQSVPSAERGRAGRVLAAGLEALDGRPVAALAQRVGGWLRARPVLLIVAGVPVAVVVLVLVVVPGGGGSVSPG